MRKNLLLRPASLPVGLAMAAAPVGRHVQERHGSSLGGAVPGRIYRRGTGNDRRIFYEGNRGDPATGISIAAN